MFPTETLFIHDRLALFGFGLFETLLITEAGTLFVDIHWKRMNKGADFLGLNLPDNTKNTEMGILKALACAFGQI